MKLSAALPALPLLLVLAGCDAGPMSPAPLDDPNTLDTVNEGAAEDAMTGIDTSTEDDLM